MLFLLLVSCEEEISTITLDNESIVVTGYLYANQPIDSIRVSKSIAYSSDGNLEVVDDLEIIINDGTEDIILESIGNGYYRNPDHVVKTETTYTLEFIYEEETISSETYIPAPVNVELSAESIKLEKIVFTGGPPSSFPEPVVVDITWDNPSKDYFFVVIENNEEDPEYVNEIFEQFSVDRPDLFFRTEPEIMDIYSINSQRELQTYGTYEIIVYRLNSDYAALYETVGSSTLSIQEPPSNVNNGLGIFTGVTPHYLSLEVTK